MLAAIAALIGWGALVLQLYLSLQLAVANGRGIGLGLIDYLSYFTILTNLLAALALSAPLAAPGATLGRYFSRPGVNAAIAAAIATVGISYSLLLRHTWAPQGPQRVADVLLHDVMPVLFLVYWWFAVTKGALRWNHIPRWCLYPVAYFLYAMVRGALAGRYPYPFIDVNALGYGRVLVNAVGMLLGFSLIALILVGADALKKDQAAPPAEAGVGR